MTLSLNEVEALAKKAARGAGFHWGIAEEAGKAVRWLCSAGADGCAVLANRLAECDGVDLGDQTPRIGKTWTARSGSLCPLMAGATLSDLADILADEDIQLKGVAHPILLAPFAGLVAQRLETSVSIQWDQTKVVTDGAALAIRRLTDAVSASATVRARATFDTVRALPKCTRADPDPEILATLNGFANRTYAPATEASRLSGAGAGLSDND